MSIQKPTDDEDKFFFEDDQRKLAALREEVVGHQDTNAAWMALADAVGSKDPAVGEKLEQLGFNLETARVLFFVPLLEVAWADGKIGYEESYRIVDTVRHRGIKVTSEAFEFLSGMTLTRPSPEFFEGCRGAIKLMLAGFSSDKREAEITSLTDLVLTVARASRGFFGFGSEISQDEREVILEIVNALGLEGSPSANELLGKL